MTECVTKKNLLAYSTTADLPRFWKRKYKNTLGLRELGGHPFRLVQGSGLLIHVSDMGMKSYQK